VRACEPRSAFGYLAPKAVSSYSVYNHTGYNQRWCAPKGTGAVFSMLLNFKYRAYPTKAQQHALICTLRLVKWGWNSMIRLARRVRRRPAHASRYRALLAKWQDNRKMTGRRSEAIKKRGAAGLTREQALAQLNSEQLHRIRMMRGSLLAAEYAQEAIDQRRKGQLNGSMGQIWVRLNAKHKDAWRACFDRIRGAPRFTKRACSAAVGIAGGKSPLTGPPNGHRETHINVSAFLLPRYRQNQQITNIKIIQHRPLPADAKVKDLKIIRTSHAPTPQWYAVLAVETEGLIDYPSTGKACGIDLGLKTAAVVAGEDIQTPGTDGFEVDPGKPLQRKLETLRRLQRKRDRQTRANNPDCYDASGVWKKGQRISHWSKGMRETENAVAKTYSHVANIRLNYYQVEVNRILSEYDTVYIGSYTDGSPQTKAALRDKRKAAFAKSGVQRKKGHARRERTINQRARDNALGIFKRLLEEKASRSKTKKRIVRIPEQNTTRTCPTCRHLTGPTGQRDLKVRSWTCSHCGSKHDRDRAAAWNILQAGLKLAETQSVTLSGDSRSKPARTPYRGKGASAASRPGREASNAPISRSSQGRVQNSPTRGEVSMNCPEALATPQDHSGRCSTKVDADERPGKPGSVEPPLAKGACDTS
jgi:transposase